MAIVAFWSNEKKETAQTLSMTALTTFMGIEHNYKILAIDTAFDETTIEDCFWNMQKVNALSDMLGRNVSSSIGLEAGIEGLIKIINSNKTSSTIVSNYAKVVFKDRFDVLCSTKVKSYEEYKNICKFYPDIIQVANRDYDFVFVDLSKTMPQEEKNRILEIADIIVVNIVQKMTSMENLMKLKIENPFFKNNNILINIGRYDRFSKYNVKNVTRYFKQVRSVDCVPYNTLFYEASSEGKVAEYFLKIRSLAQPKKQPLLGKEEDRNEYFIKQVSKFSEDIIYKWQELQMRG